MNTILKIFTLIFLCVWFFIPSEVAYGIKPGETKKYWVREGRTDKHRTSKNGLRTFAIWVPDDQTVVEARWYEEVRGGLKWVLRGSACVREKDKRFSRTVYLRRTENLKLEVTGITPSRGERRRCYYWVHCIDDPYYNVRTYESRNFKHLNTWFKADNYQRWYWCGCACWVVVNSIDKEIVLFDGYVSKATWGANHDYTYDKAERKRVAKFVNLLRYFISQNYRIVGILTSHKHGDHVGDIPYILGGIRADRDSDFMRTGIALTGRVYKRKITVVDNAETFIDARWGNSTYDSKNYYEPKPEARDIYMPLFNGRVYIDNKDFATGKTFNLGKFTIQPYIWDHGRIADGGAGSRGDIRTLAYRIWRRQGTKRAIVFFTSGFCEDKKFVDTINRTIPCHHIIFAWNEDEYNGESTKTISLLGDSPVGYNYIFTNHTDNNSNTGDIDDGREEVIDMFGMFLEGGVVDYYDCVNSKVKWRGQERNIKLGAFYNRLGVD